MTETGSADRVAAGFAGMWSDLAPVGRDGQSGGYRRFAWSDVDHELREWFADQAARRPNVDLVDWAAKSAAAQRS